MMEFRAAEGHHHRNYQTWSILNLDNCVDNKVTTDEINSNLKII